MNIKNITVKQLPELYVAAVAHKGNYGHIHEAFNSLMNWGMPKGLFNHQPCLLAIYHDNPCEVPQEELSSDACLVVDKKCVIEGSARPYIVSGGKYLVVNAEVTMGQFAELWHRAYQIADEKELVCDTGDHYELYLNDPGNDPDALFLVDICLPVK